MTAEGRSLLEAVETRRRVARVRSALRPDAAHLAEEADLRASRMGGPVGSGVRIDSGRAERRARDDAGSEGRETQPPSRRRAHAASVSSPRAASVDRYEIEAPVCARVGIAAVARRAPDLLRRLGPGRGRAALRRLERRRLRDVLAGDVLV